MSCVFVTQHSHHTVPTAEIKPLTALLGCDPPVNHLLKPSPSHLENISAALYLLINTEDVPAQNEAVCEVFHGSKEQCWGQSDTAWFIKG